MKKIIQLISILFISILAILLGLLVWLSITDYKPSLRESVTVTNNNKLKASTEITIFDWNIGYGALGAESDFFFDGGESVITPLADYHRYFTGIMDIIKQSDADIYFFQEVDRNSKRSYYNDQLEEISTILPMFNRSFAINYDVEYIPPPALFKTSFGKVEAGVATFSKFETVDAHRLSLPGSYSWPKSILFLDRCMLVTRVETEDNKNVVFINTHNSAYDQGGFIKKEQLQFIKEFALSEYQDGNYVVIGGDWNSYMPGSDGNTFKSVEEASVYNQGFPDGWSIEGWKWGVDTSLSTSRSLKDVYVKGQNFECIIDGFLISPNLDIKKIKTYDLGFKYSDHNPVEINLILK